MVKFDKLKIRAKDRTEAKKKIRKFLRDRDLVLRQVSLKDRRKLAHSRDYIWDNVTIHASKDLRKGKRRYRYGAL